MASPVVQAMGESAWKYYMLFQHHTPPKGESPEDESWVLGQQPGPYIQERSRSVCTTLGKHVVFLGLDCRTERTMHRIVRPSTYDAVFARIEKEVRKDEIKHLIVLLPSPVIFPRQDLFSIQLRKLQVHNLSNRLMALENVLSQVGAWTADWPYTPIWLKILLKPNRFDGKPGILDDLIDHC